MVLSMPFIRRAATCALSMAPPFRTPSALRLASFTLSMKPAGRDDGCASDDHNWLMSNAQVSCRLTLTWIPILFLRGRQLLQGN